MVGVRVKTVLALLIAVNLLWSSAFLGFTRRPGAPLAKQPPETNRPVLATAPMTSTAATPPTPVVFTNISPTASPSNAPVIEPPSLAQSAKKFGWADVTNEAYVSYLARLRAAGAPDKQVRRIVVTDVNELFDQRRLEHAIKSDAQWWKAETPMGILPMQDGAGANFDGQRRELLGRILGEDELDALKLAPWSSPAISLTGPVLGALPSETWNAVQDIYSRSMERHLAYQTARINEGKPVENLELAQLRDRTRTDLAKVLTAEQLEEFLLRHSQNSSSLRTNLIGLQLSPEEFRKFFRAIDPLEHRVQIDYGGPEALSARQREQLEAQHDRAAREALTPEHFKQYLAAKDPSFKQAQVMAGNYGLNGRAVQPLHDMQKNLEARRAQVGQSAALSEEQKQEALRAIGLDHQQMLQRILSDTAYRR